MFRITCPVIVVLSCTVWYERPSIRARVTKGKPYIHHIFKDLWYIFDHFRPIIPLLVLLDKITQQTIIGNITYVLKSVLERRIAKTYKQIDLSIFAEFKKLNYYIFVLNNQTDF